MNEPSTEREALVKAAEAWAGECDELARWARTPSDRAAYRYRSSILRSLIGDVSAERQLLGKVWAAFGCAHNPDDFKKSARDQMWVQVIEMAREANTRDSRVYRENQSLERDLFTEREKSAALQRIIDGYDRTPAETRAFEAERDLAAEREKVARYRAQAESAEDATRKAEQFWREKVAALEAVINRLREIAEAGFPNVPIVEEATHTLDALWTVLDAAPRDALDARDAEKWAEGATAMNPDWDNPDMYEFYPDGNPYRAEQEGSGE